MSVSSISESAAEAAELLAPRRTRIDAAHAAEEHCAAASSDGAAMLEVEEPSQALIEAVTGQSVESRREQLQLQVSQLAGHLRERLREVDRREAHVNARASQLEADLRASRLWLQERDHEFQEREIELKRQIEELQERLGGRVAESAGAVGNASGAVGNALRGVPDSADDFAIAQHELAERDHDLRLKENDLRERRFELERQAAALRHAQQVWQQQRESEERDLAQSRVRLEREFAERIAEHESNLRASEALVAEHSRQLEQDRAALLADRQAWESQRARQVQTLEDERRASDAELVDRTQRLDARQDWIERQKGGLDQTQAEILSLHRQSLEMRLIAEQLWSQIAGRLTPAEITHAIAQTRLKLSEQFKLEEQSLEEKKEELVALSRRIHEQHAELKQMQSGLREWATARQTEIEQQAQALVERELALDAEQERQRQSQRQWQADRRSYEQQIRDLASQLRAPAAA